MANSNNNYETRVTSTTKTEHRNDAGSRKTTSKPPASVNPNSTKKRD